MKGKAYCIGVGPGDPELMTLKAVRLIRESDIIAVPGNRPEESVAYRIALRAVPEIKDKKVIALPSPMKMDMSAIKDAHRQSADTIKKYLDKPNLKIAGILMNRVDLRTNYTKVMIDYSEEVFKELNIFKTLIPTSVKVDECILLNNYIGDCLPNNPVAKAYKLFVDEYLENNNMEVKAV